MPGSRRAISDRQPKRESAVQHRARNEDFARCIHPFLNGAILVVAFLLA